MIDLLNEVGHHPKKIGNLETMKIIADIIRFILTLFVHEQGVDYRLLAAILDVSQVLYF